MNRQEEALRLASELLEHIELQRLKASEIVLKASRVARLVDHDELSTFLRYEREGYPLDGSATAWLDPGPVTRQPGTAPSAGCRHAVTHIRTIRPS
ncbi:AbiTii domain-containing protein [Nocardia niigatensis]